MNKITNCMEISVKKCLDKLIEESNVCKCEKCRYDMMAIVLHNLKPYYVTTNLDEVITKIKNMEQQSEANIVVEVTKAIKMKGYSYFNSLFILYSYIIKCKYCKYYIMR